MSATLEELLPEFERLVARRIGVQVRGKAYLVRSRLTPIAAARGLASVEELLEAIQRPGDESRDAAVDAMTTNETSFFRDAHPFEALAGHLIPEMAKARAGRITVWCAAGSSGQEAYSTLMAVQSSCPALIREGRIRVLSTDVSPAMVERAADGRYSAFEVRRGMSAHQLDQFFEPDGRHFRIRADLRGLVDARVLNLLGPWTGVPRASVVVLRNVLIYFDEPARRRIVERLRDEVMERDGVLLLGASERLPDGVEGFEAERLGSTTVFRRHR